MDLQSYARRDLARRALGQWLADWGWGPRQGSYRVALETPSFRLRDYGGSGPALFMLPAPIKRAYIWDLAPACSVVRRAAAAGFRPWLVEWLAPGGEGGGLDDYGARWPRRCAEAIAAGSGETKLFLAGHSLGGTLAAIFATLHPQQVRGLVLLAAPLDFAPQAGVLRTLVTELPVEALPAGAVPGSFLNALGVAAAPMTFGAAPWLDWWACLPDGEARDTLLQVQRWALDELPLPGRLLAQVAQRLYRDNAFMGGTLMLEGRRALPQAFAAPLACVADPRCSLVPPAAMQPFLDAVGSRSKRLLYYEGDAGVLLQHVGMLVGGSAHARLWPQILGWLRRFAA